MDVSKLPPKPDPQTGEPRPPSAPLEPGNRKPDDRREQSWKKVPAPPAGEGPILEWFYPQRSSRMISGLLLSLLVLLTVMIKDWTQGNSGFSWVGIWWMWLIILAGPFVLLVLEKGSVSAGADWLANRKGVVKTYELVKVKVSVGSGGAAHELQIKDKYGNAASDQITHLQQNHQLWDLVYNGLIHSVHVNGAETNQRARDYLLLEYPPTVDT